MRHKFISLKEPSKYGYSYDSSAYEGRTCFCEKFRQCETYGDTHANGHYTQHSGDWCVQVDYISDYMAFQRLNTLYPLDQPGVNLLGATNRVIREEVVREESAN